MESIDLTPQDAYDIADGFALASSEILKARIRLRGGNLEKAKELEKAEDALDSFVVLFRGYGIRLIGQSAQAAASDLQQSIAKATETLENIRKIKSAIEIATALVGIAVALYANDAKGVGKAITATAKAIKEAKDQAE